MPITAEQIAAIAAGYGLALRRVIPISGGHSNINCRLHCREGDFVLTLFCEESADSVDRLARLLLQLTADGFTTTRPLAMPDGALTTSCQGRPVLLKYFVEGDVVPVWRDIMLQQVGAAVAGLHRLAVPDYVTRHHPYDRLFSIVSRSAIDRRYADWFTGRLAQFEQHTSAALPTAIVHGDIFWDNVLFADERLQAIIDFECACHKPRLFDIAMTLIGTCCAEMQLVWPQARALLGGYQAVTPLLAAEKEALQGFVVYTAAITSCWRFWKSKIDAPEETRIRDFGEMVGLADTVRALPADAFSAALFD